MKRYLVVLVKGWCLWIVLALLAGGCQTLQFRDIQDDYNAAVEAEAGERTVISEASSSSQGIPVNTYDDRYREIIRQLDRNFIKGLDKKLQPTAYVMLTASHISLKQYKEARNSAKTGREHVEAAQSPRDRVYLQAADGIILLGTALQRYGERDPGKPFTLMEYNETGGDQFLSYPDAFEKAYNNFSGVLNDPGNSNAPESIKVFIIFQKLRVLTHWNEVFSEITDKGDIDEKLKLYTKIKQDLNLQLVPDPNSMEGKTCVRAVFVQLSCDNMNRAKVLDQGMTRNISYNHQGKTLRLIYEQAGVYKTCSKACFK